MTKGKSGISAILALALSGQMVLAPCAEASVWRERRQRQEVPRLARAVQLAPPIHQALSLTSTVPRRSGDTGPAMDPPSPLRAALSHDIGTVRGASGDPSGRVVIHIQDVHMNPEAQANIGRAVERLVSGSLVSLVALEGADGPLLLEPFQAFPHRRAIEAAIDHLSGKNRLSGAVAALLKEAPGGPAVVGVDPASLYARNVDAVRRSRSVHASARADLARLAARLTAEKARRFSADLAAFDDLVAAHAGGAMPFGDYLKSLSALVSGPTPASVRDFLAAADLEKSLDFDRAERERSAAIGRLAASLPPSRLNALASATAAYRAGSSSHGEFHQLLEEAFAEAGVPLSAYPAFLGYLRYMRLADGIDVDVLFADVTAMEIRGYRRRVADDADRRLVAAARLLRQSDRLVKFALTRGDWDAYLADLKAIPPAGADLAADVAGWARSPAAAPFFDFYRAACERDAAMAARLLAAMDHEDAGVAVFVSGGFHARGVKAALTRRGVSMISFVPRVSTIDVGGSTAYLSVFTQDKSPLDRLFEGKKLFLSPRAFTAVHAVNIAAFTTGTGLLGEDFTTAEAAPLFSTLVPASIAAVSDARLINGAAEIDIALPDDRGGITATVTDQGDATFAPLKKFPAEAPGPRKDGRLLLLAGTGLFALAQALRLGIANRWTAGTGEDITWSFGGFYPIFNMESLGAKLGLPPEADVVLLAGMVVSALYLISTELRRARRGLPTFRGLALGVTLVLSGIASNVFEIATAGRVLDYAVVPGVGVANLADVVISVGLVLAFAPALFSWLRREAAELRGGIGAWRVYRQALRQTARRRSAGSARWPIFALLVSALVQATAAPHAVAQDPPRPPQAAADGEELSPKERQRLREEAGLPKSGPWDRLERMERARREAVLLAMLTPYSERYTLKLNQIDTVVVTPPAHRAPTWDSWPQGRTDDWPPPAAGEFGRREGSVTNPSFVFESEADFTRYLAASKTNPFDPRSRESGRFAAFSFVKTLAEETRRVHLPNGTVDTGIGVSPNEFFRKELHPIIAIAPSGDEIIGFKDLDAFEAWAETRPGMKRDGVYVGGDVAGERRVALDDYGPRGEHGFSRTLDAKGWRVARRGDLALVDPETNETVALYAGRAARENGDAGPARPGDTPLAKTIGKLVYKVRWAVEGAADDPAWQPYLKWLRRNIRKGFQHPDRLKEILEPEKLEGMVKEDGKYFRWMSSPGAAVPAEIRFGGPDGPIARFNTAMGGQDPIRFFPKLLMPAQVTASGGGETQYGPRPSMALAYQSHPDTPPLAAISNGLRPFMLSQGGGTTVPYPRITTPKQYRDYKSGEIRGPGDTRPVEGALPFLNPTHIGSRLKEHPYYDAWAEGGEIRFEDEQIRLEERAWVAIRWLRDLRAALNARLEAGTGGYDPATLRTWIGQLEAADGQTWTDPLTGLVHFVVGDAAVEDAVRARETLAAEAARAEGPRGAELNKALTLLDQKLAFARTNELATVRPRVSYAEQALLELQQHLFEMRRRVVSLEDRVLTGDEAAVPLWKAAKDELERVAHAASFVGEDGYPRTIFFGVLEPSLEDRLLERSFEKDPAPPPAIEAPMPEEGAAAAAAAAPAWFAFSWLIELAVRLVRRVTSGRRPASSGSGAAAAAFQALIDGLPAEPLGVADLAVPLTREAFEDPKSRPTILAYLQGVALAYAGARPTSDAPFMPGSQIGKREKVLYTARGLAAADIESEVRAFTAEISRSQAVPVAVILNADQEPLLDALRGAGLEAYVWSSLGEETAMARAIRLPNDEGVADLLHVTIAQGAALPANLEEVVAALRDRLPNRVIVSLLLATIPKVVPLSDGVIREIRKTVLLLTQA